MSSLGYYLLFGFTWLLSLLPFWLLYRIADLLYIFNFYVIRYRKEIVYKNLRLAFPEKSDAEIDRIARKFYHHFSDFLVEVIKGFSVSQKVLEKRMKVMDLEIFRQIFAEKRDFALVSAHYNNWEWLTCFPFYIPHHFTAVYRPLSNKIMDRLQMYLRRHRTGCTMTAMEQVSRKTFKYRAENRPFGVWLLADQRPPQNSKFWTVFLNQEVSFFEGVEKLTRKLDLAVVFMDIRKIKRGYYEAHFTRITEAQELPENGIMLECVRMMEEEIRQVPEYWLWSHNRFKHKRPADAKLIIP
jgi:Kdo2-lipid IVA lauroyltransferase/acyltransferase